MKTLPAIALLIVTLSACGGGGGGGGGGTEPGKQPPTTIEPPWPTSPPPTAPSPRGRAPDTTKLAQDLHRSFGGTFKCVLKGPADRTHWLYECHHNQNPGVLVVIAASDGTVVSIHSEPG